MPLFINKDQMFAHQVQLLEHKVRNQEERTLELETENAILHLRLSECLTKLRRENEDESNKRNKEKQTQTSLISLLSDVQVLKQDLSELFAVYVNFSSEVEEQSKELVRRTEQSRYSSNTQDGDHVQALKSRVEALERSLEEEKQRYEAERQRRKELHNTLVDLRGSIRVHCRVRPVLTFDHTQPSTSGSGLTASDEVIHAFSDDTVLVKCVKTGAAAQNKMFEFDRVYGPEENQDVVYEEVRSLLTSLMDGYNVCIMAYGQTGSGKTHTMLGCQPLEEQLEHQQGIISKAAAELFQLISEKPSDFYTVELSVMEVYNNELFDLLCRDEHGNYVGQRRDVIMTSSGTSDVTALTHEPVSSVSNVLEILGSVVKLRAHSPTLIHPDSSRSHLVVTFTVSSKSPNAVALARRLQNAKKDLQRCGSAHRQWWSPRCRRANAASDELFPGTASSSPSPCHSPSPSPSPSVSQTSFRTKLQLVDLAGSECVGMSGSSGASLREASCINRSLSALSDVLGALAEQRPHVPYRNSKLTHLLQDAIGGDAKLLLILCVSPTQHFISESLHSLAFGLRARQIHKENTAGKRTHNLRVK